MDFKLTNLYFYVSNETCNFLYDGTSNFINFLYIITFRKSDIRKQGNEKASNVTSVSPQILELQKKLEERRALRTKI